MEETRKVFRDNYAIRFLLFCLSFLPSSKLFSFRGIMESRFWRILQILLILSCNDNDDNSNNQYHDDRYHHHYHR